MKKYILAFVVVFALLTALAFGLYSVYKPKEIVPNRAAVQGGAANFTVSPATSTIPPGNSVLVDLIGNLPQGTGADGFQIVATVSGTIPPGIQWNVATPSGMVNVLNDASGSPQGLTIKLAFVTQNPQVPYTAASTILGSLSFTAPASGQTTISFDNTLSKIVEHGTSQDIAAIPVGATYTYQTTATTSPTPTAPPGSTTAPTPTATPASNTTCVRGNQSIALTPSTQSALAGKSLTYTVKVTNNDDNNCEKANFSLSAILPFSNWIASFAQQVLSLSPQTSGTTTVTITSNVNSPIGTLPVGVNAVGPKSAVVAAANYVILAPTPTPKPKATPEVVVVPGGATPIATASPLTSPLVEPTIEPVVQEPGGILAQIPTAVLYAIGAFLLIVLFFILRALFSNKNNPPKITPPTETPVPPTPMPPAPTPVNQPSLSHSVEPPVMEPPFSPKAV